MILVGIASLIRLKNPSKYLLGMKVTSCIQRNLLKEHNWTPTRMVGITNFSRLVLAVQVSVKRKLKNMMKMSDTMQAAIA
jgi:hypothetical protein